MKAVDALAALADEVVHSRPWLTAQLELVQPRVVVTLGRRALDTFQPGLKSVRCAVGRRQPAVA